MRAGKLRTLITIQRSTSARGSFGESLETWAPLCQCYGAVAPLSGREFWQAQQMHSEITYKIQIRPPATKIKSADRAQFEGRTLEIVSALPERDCVWLLCKELVA